jgi:ribosomal protein S15P/S13E
MSELEEAWDLITELKQELDDKVSAYNNLVKQYENLYENALHLAKHIKTNHKKKPNNPLLEETDAYDGSDEEEKQNIKLNAQISKQTLKKINLDDIKKALNGNKIQIDVDEEITQQRNIQEIKKSLHSTDDFYLLQSTSEPSEGFYIFIITNKIPSRIILNNGTFSSFEEMSREFKVGGPLAEEIKKKYNYIFFRHLTKNQKDYLFPLLKILNPMKLSLISELVELSKSFTIPKP